LNVDARDTHLRTGLRLFHLARGRFGLCETVQDALLAQQSTGDVRWLGSVPEPAQRLFLVQDNGRGIDARILRPDGVDEATISCLGAIGDHDTVDGAFLSSHALQSNLDWHSDAPFGTSPDAKSGYRVSGKLAVGVLFAFDYADRHHVPGR